MTTLNVAVIWMILINVEKPGNPALSAMTTKPPGYGGVVPLVGVV